MIKVLPRYILRFVTLVLIQVFLLDNIQFSGYINPYIYVLFILLLPFETPNWILLIIAFILGVSIDSFLNTLGMHTSATVFMAFLRPYALSYIAPRDGYEPGTLPNIHYHGFEWFLRYALIMVFAHHFFLFFVEAFKVTYFFSTLLRITLSVVFSVTFIVISQYFIYRK